MFRLANLDGVRPQAIATLLYVDGLTQQEVADVLQLS